MAFSDLHEFVQGQFAAFAGYDEYDAQLTIWCYRQRAANSHKTKRLSDWKRRNPKRQREHARRWEAAHPEKTRARKARWRKANPDYDRNYRAKYRVANREKVRAWNRKNQAARRARLKAAANL